MSRVPFIECLLLSAVLSVAAAAQQSQQPQRSPQEKSDAGASIGLVLDNSKSMAAKRDAMVAAMHLLVQATNPSDEFFVVNFNEHPYLDQEFTENRSLIGAALDKAGARGGTALYDALSAAVDHLNKAAHHQKHMLVLISDGGDNESNIPSKQLLDGMRGPIQEPVIYSIGLFDPGDDSRAANFLRQLAKETGGKVIFVPKPKKLNAAAQQLADEMRKQESGPAREQK